MTDRERKQIEQAMREMDALRRKHGVTMGNEPNQAQIDAIQAQMLRGDLSSMSIDDILKGLG